jgi:hypothetical protein
MDAGFFSPNKGHVFTEEHMGMQFYYELTASCLAGGLGGTRERLLKTLRRLNRTSPLDAQGDPDRYLENTDCRSPTPAAAITQSFEELTDIWHEFTYRPIKFRKTEELVEVLKDKILEGFDNNFTLWIEYHRLAQHLNALELDSSQENPEFHI